MRRFLFVFAGLLIFTFLIESASAQGLSCVKTIGAEEVVRLHVRADNDTDEAQTLKLRVRDSVLDATRVLLKDVQDAEEAYEILSHNAEAILIAARARAEREGYTGDVRLTIGNEQFPDRKYGNVFLPAGTYRAVCVEIGSGEGHNWWCVIYPSLCYYGTPTQMGEIRFYSSLRTWIMKLFDGGDAA